MTQPGDPPAPPFPGPPTARHDAAVGVHPPRFTPAQPRRAVGEIIRQIAALIADGTLRQGDKLPPERVLAAQLQVSRNTLREALRMLELSGLVTARKGASGGSFIASTDLARLDEHRVGPLRLSEFSVADLTGAMRAVTAMLLHVAVPALTAADLAAMEANLAQAEGAADDPRRRSGLLIGFYRLLAEAGGNPVLVALTEVFTGMLGDWVVRIGSVSDDRVLRARRAMLGHLRRGDAKAALAGIDAYLGELHGYWLHEQDVPGRLV